MVLTYIFYIIYLCSIGSFGLCFTGITGALSTSTKHSSLDRVAVLGCGYYLAKISNWDYNYSRNAGFYDTICNYPPAFQSWALCVYISVDKNNETFKESFHQIESKCRNTPIDHVLTLTDYYDALYNGIEYVQPEPKYTQLKINFPIYTNDSIRNQLIGSYYTYSRNLEVANLYSIYIYIYFSMILLVSTLLNYCQYTSFNNVFFKYKLLRFFRGYIIIPTLFKEHAAYFNCGKLIIGLLPTRSESLVILGYIVQHIYLLSSGFQYDPNHCLFADMRIQKLRFFADRAGILAFANLPIIILLSTRNTICEYLTGVKYATSIMFHKWIGRIMFIDVMLHGGSYVLYSVMTKTFQNSIQMAYYQFGFLAFLGLITLVVFSIGYFRRYYYETFLYGHILLALWFFYSCWKHVEKLGWKEWIYASLLIWVTERLFRLFRILNSGILDAHLQLIGDSLIRITVHKPTNPYSGVKDCLNSKPGQYYFIYFLQPSIFWQSHPFSVMNFDKKIVMVIKPKYGITKHLYNLVKKSPTGECTMKVGIEGPYGSKSILHHSTDILFLTGGTGILGPLSHILELCSNRNIHCKINLFAVLRDTSILHAFKNELFKLQDMPVNVNIFITDPNFKNQRKEMSNELFYTNSYSPLLSSNKNLDCLETFCTFHFNRPNIEEIINHSVHESSSSLSVVCCGPPSFVDSTRNFVSRAIISNEGKSISYFEEFQCW